MATSKVTARPPFTSTNTAADLILKTSDGERFYVIKAIMAAASPIFEDMLVVAQPQPCPGQAENGEEEAEERPVVDLTEASWTVDALLRICYPISNPLLTELGPSSQVLQLLEASRKYAIAPVMDTCKEYLRKHHLPKDPMGVYVIACKYGMEDLARTAAIGTLGESQEKVLDCNRPETGAVTFACVQRLRAFRKECQTAICALLDITVCVAWPSIQKLFEGTTPMPAPVGQPYGSAQAGYATYPTCCFTSTFTIGGANAVVVRDWWVGYAKELRKIFANVRTTGWQVAAQEEAYVETLKTVMKCAVCRKSNLKYLESFKIEVQQKLTQTVHAVAKKYQFTD